MADRLRYPDRIEWAEKRESVPAGGLGHYWDGSAYGDDALEHAELRAHPDGFTVSLGSFTTTGDAGGFEQAKRCSEAALRALIDLNNTLSQPPGTDPLERLSGRERDVVEGLRRGKRLRTLSRDLVISQHTARNHLKHVFRKLGVHSQVELLALLSGGARG